MQLDGCDIQADQSFDAIEDRFAIQSNEYR